MASSVVVSASSSVSPSSSTPSTSASATLPPSGMFHGGGWTNVFVPGRICLFGEHSDWAGTYRRFNSDIVEGHALVCGTRQGLYAKAKRHSSKFIVKSITNAGTMMEFECDMNPTKLKEIAQQGGFFSYACGVAHEIVTNYHVRGLEIVNWKTDLPIKKGLSSSAAICVLVTRAFNRVYDLKLTVRGEMDFAYRGEILTPSRCGRLDQCCAFGNTVVEMMFDADTVSTREVKVKEELYMVLVDLKGTKDTKEILARLNKCYPFAENELERNVHNLLGATNKAIVNQAIQALEEGKGTGEAIGKLMIQAQSEFDRFAAPACPHELTAPKLHKVLTYPAIQSLIYGGKGVGSQGDGTAQLVAKSQDDQDKLIQILERDLGVSCLKLVLGSVQKVRKAVIPAAGYGRRLFPATKAIKAPMFPLMDMDGVMKPAILIIVEEILSAGIDEVALVIQKNDHAVFKELFHEKLSIENYNTLSDSLKEYSKKILALGERVRLIDQEFQDGFGHAVWEARDFVGEEPFLLVLGDILHRSNESRSCVRQLLDAAEDNPGCSVISITEVDEKYLSEVGVVSGVWMPSTPASTPAPSSAVVSVPSSPSSSSSSPSSPSSPSSSSTSSTSFPADCPAPLSLLEITKIVEKPTIDYAREHLQGAPDRFYGMFGHYVLSPKVFSLLQHNISHNIRTNGVFELTSCLDTMRKDGKFLGLLANGRKYDIGTPQHYLETSVAFAQLAGSHM